MKLPRAPAVLAFLLAPMAIALAQGPPVPASRRQQESVTQAKLDKVKAQIAALAVAQQQTANQRSALDGQIAQASQGLAAATARRTQADAALAATQLAMTVVQGQVAAQQSALARQRATLATLLQAAYALGPDSGLRALLGDADLASIGRALVYARYLQQQRLTRIDALHLAMERLATRQAALIAEQQRLTAARQTALAALAAQTDARHQLQALRAQADARYRDEKARLAALAQQQQDLEELLARLRDIFADIPKQLPGNVPFPQLKGHLPWPIAGRTRPWQGGLLIDPGTSRLVHAVANGRVAYADWLRGFGMLVVVDQGDGWITLYGNNESLLVRVGDWVAPGQVIAHAGTTAAGFEGTWFALRHNGKPVDAGPWLAPTRR